MAGIWNAIEELFVGMATKFHRFFVSPLYQASLTLLLLFAGGYGSIYSPEIRSAFPFHWGPFDGWSWPAAIFWLLAVISLLLFYFRNAAVEHTRVLDQDSLNDSVRHAPNKDFLARFAVEHRRVSVLVDRALDNDQIRGDREKLEEAIRAVLRAIAEFVQEMDADYRAGRYAANVMVFVPAEKLASDPALKAEIVGRLNFCDPDVGIENLDGVLDMKTDFSAVADNADKETDDQLRAFALPIPKEALSSEGKFRVGPGAPEAFVLRECCAYASVQDILFWVRNRADLKKEVLRQFEDYFSKEQQIQSFISIPVARENSTSEQPIAILSVHSDRPDLLSDTSGSKIEYCAPLLDPFSYLLFQLLDAWQQAPEMPAPTPDPASVETPPTAEPPNG